MAEVAGNLIFPSWVHRITRYRALFVPIAAVSLLSLLIVPMPPLVMDLLIAANLALAAIILLTTIFVESPLDFSVFPSLLLATTLFRLVLNVATTRLILSADAETPADATAVAGRVIETFSSFVASGSLIVGLILFIILIVVQFVVITKGATRISEVAARFTLDGMPGKQMAIDADLNAGLINEQQARERREAISQEADFYGAMDGAVKFVRGDAIAGIIITVINIVGGIAVGYFYKDWQIVQCLEVFTKLTIGDGLVSQLPAFIISVAAGLIVTRSSSRSNLGMELTSQITGSWRALAITAGFLGIMAFTGLPMVPMLTLGAIIGAMAFFLRGGERKQAEAAQQAVAQSNTQAEQPSVEQMLQVDTMELEVGYALVQLVDASQGGDLLERISMIRRQLAGELGLVMPPVRIRDNMQLEPNDYHIKIRGNSVAQGTVYPDRVMAMDSGLASEPLEGVPTREPAFNLAATWIDPSQKAYAESLNYTVVDTSSVLATHLTEVVKNHAHELLTREETNNLIAQLKESAPKLVDEVLGGESPLIRPGQLQKVLQNLLRERVPIRDMEAIIETLGDWAPRTKDMDVLTEYVRNALRRTICSQYVTRELEASEEDMLTSVPVSKLFCVSLDPAVEDLITGYVERSAEGTSMTMPPSVANKITVAMISELQRLVQAGHHPVVLASPQVRGQVRRLIEPHLPNAAVLGYNEVGKGIHVESMGLVQLDEEQPQRETEALQGAVT